MDQQNLTTLAQLLKERAENDRQISRVIGRPAQIGHTGEYIAAQIFDIQLQQSASHKAIDGYFRSGPLARRSVNIKWATKNDGLLNITPNALPDYYLVMTGPITAAGSSRGTTAPWVIDHVYLFQAANLVQKLSLRGVKIGVATSVANIYWDEAEIYPRQRNKEYILTDSMRQNLALFSSPQLTAR